MPKRGIVIASALAAVLVVGGGTATAIALSGQAGEAPETIATSSAPEPSTQPAETEPSEENSSEAGEANDAEFVAYVRSEMVPETGIRDATDDWLVSAGREACDQLIAGVDSEEIRLVEGEEPALSGYYMDSGVIIDGARRFYCPETFGEPPA